MSITVLDVETAPQPAALAAPYPKADRTPPANYKNDDAIAKWYERDEADWRTGLAKRAALSPQMGRIIAAGWTVEDSGEDIPTAIVDLEDEAKLIRHALGAIAEAGQLVTFNGLAFDIPFLHIRAAVHGIPIPYHAPNFTRRYDNVAHADLLAVLSAWQRPAEGDTLHNWARAFGIEVTDATTGADVGPMLDAGNLDGIATHLRSDLTLTAQLARKLRRANII